VWLGEAGALAGLAPGALAIECSTLTVAWVNELARAAGAAGVEFVDAPVTGSKGPAASGELNFLVGGSPAGFGRAEPVLRPMSRSIMHLGPAGSGALVKLVNNFLSGVQVAAFAEALAWLERSGVDRAKALAIITEGAPGSPIVRLMQARMCAPDYAPNFFLRLMAKDLGYALEESDRAGLGLKTAAAALERFREAVAAGHGDKDMAAVVEPLRRQAE
jgi:3-hydroxyisobutyrate dehydrogenase